MESKELDSVIYGLAKVLDVASEVDTGKILKHLSNNLEDMAGLSIKTMALLGDLVSVLGPTLKNVVKDVLEDEDNLKVVSKFVDSTQDVADLSVEQIRKLLSSLI